MKAWAARNEEDGMISIYAQKPILIEEEEDGVRYSFYTASEGDVEFLETYMDEDFHAEVTVENSPMRIELTNRDLLSILKRRHDNSVDFFERMREMAGGRMPITEVGGQIREMYILNHFISLLEANETENETI